MKEYDQLKYFRNACEGDETCSWHLKKRVAIVVSDFDVLENQVVIIVMN